MAKTAQARALRRNATDAEKKLWSLLRDRRLVGWKFRRQVPLGPYVVDFYCSEARLVVEADGGQHANSCSDEHRTAWLGRNGYRVKRYWNNDILTNPEGIFIDLLETLT
ncbi:MAG: endonuclease domain-containing protein [Rhodospirillaceae bacterium]|nr:endonuclease domain-containing protein [Rhodospirillaceae bacterium]